MGHSIIDSGKCNALALALQQCLEPEWQLWLALFQQGEDRLIHMVHANQERQYEHSNQWGSCTRAADCCLQGACSGMSAEQRSHYNTQSGLFSTHDMPIVKDLQ